MRLLYLYQQLFPLSVFVFLFQSAVSLKPLFQSELKIPLSLLRMTSIQDQSLIKDIHRTLKWRTNGILRFHLFPPPLIFCDPNKYNLILWRRVLLNIVKNRTLKILFSVGQKGDLFGRLSLECVIFLYDNGRWPVKLFATSEEVSAVHMGFINSWQQ